MFRQNGVIISLRLFTKKGSLSYPNNYRGITLIDCICKTFVTILINRLSNWFDECNSKDEAQAGFRKKYSAVDNFFILMSFAQKYLSKTNGRFYCIFIDFEKAFDNVKHER